MEFILNNKIIKSDVPQGMVLLDFIRYKQNLKGTKIGCREGDCGACTVLVGELLDGEMRYRAVNSCLMAVGNANGKHIVTVEGITGKELNPIQQAMCDEGATQCGFCTPGFVMSLAGFCLSNNDTITENAVASVDGNICRCTGYKPIERAADRVNELLLHRKETNIIKYAVDNKIIPAYFLDIKNQLQAIPEKAAWIANKQAINLGGGTDLYVQKHDKMVDAEVNLMFDNSTLKGISKNGSICYVGGANTVTDLCESDIIKQAFPNFNAYAKLISSTPIRHTATIAGNFINASPIGDFTIFFLALDAQLILSDGDQTREIALRNLYKGYKTLDKKPEEYIQQFYFESPDKNTLFNFEKVSKRTHLDIASVNTAIKIIMDGDIMKEVNISSGGIGPIPQFLIKASAYLNGKKPSLKIINEAIIMAQSEISPISDARGSEAYKRLLLGQLIKAHFITLFGENILEQKLDKVLD